jgi:hypothetical protein
MPETCRRPAPPQDRPTPNNSATTTIAAHSDASLLDLNLVGANGDIWAQLFNGKFRLAVQCDVCGRWLTAGASKAAGRGPNCSARAVKR